MPKATDSRPVVGTFTCSECGTVASLFQAKRGRVKGLLYKRCACGCDQRTGVTIQNQWRQVMEPRPGFEDLKLSVQEPNEASNGAELEQIEEPEPEPRGEPNREPKAKGGLLVVFATVAVGLLAMGGIRA